MISFLLLAIVLVWDPNQESDLAGYHLYQGGESGRYTNRTTLGTVTINRLGRLRSGTYFFAVTAFNTSGLESDFSNEVEWNEPWQPWRIAATSCPPAGISLLFDTYAGQPYVIESSPFLQSWFGWNDRAQVTGTGDQLEISFPIQEEAEYFRVRTL
jgi:hypothetical protein